MKHTALTLSGLSAPAISLVDGAIAYRDQLLATAAPIKEVNEFTLEAASDALRLIKEATRAVEAQRVGVKAPVLKLGKEIDTVANQFTAPLDAEASRLSRLIGAHVEAERRRVAEAEAERERIILANEEAARKAEADAQKSAAAAFLADEEAPTPVSALLAPLPPPVAPFVTPAGIQTRKAWKYEVDDIAALYAARPDLVTLEPNGRAILSELAKSEGAPVPGLKIWQETAATSKR